MQLLKGLHVRWEVCARRVGGYVLRNSRMEMDRWGVMVVCLGIFP